jgi:hypothetical protein
VTGKPTVADLGLNPDTQPWQRSGEGAGAIEVAFVQAAASPSALAPATPEAQAPRVPGPPAAEGPVTFSATGEAFSPAHSADLAEWVLMRVADDPEGRILVFDRHEWECFLDGARKGEFDDAANDAANDATSPVVP